VARRTEAAAAAEGEEATEEEAPAKSKKADKPEGWISPVLFAKLYSCQRAGVEPSVENYAVLDTPQQVRPQSMYGLINNNAKFAEAAVEKNTDGHLMINQAAGLEFLATRDAAKVEKDAAKAAEAAAE
jgi:hypothetical protein